MKKGVDIRPSLRTNCGVCCVTLISLLAFAVFAVTTASAQDLRAAHSVDSETYKVGSELTVTTQITYKGTLSAIGINVDLPDNWTYIGKGGEDSPSAKELDSGDIEFYWTEIPKDQIDFTYTVKVPETSIGQKQISATVKYRHTEGEIQEPILPDPLYVDAMPDDAYLFEATHTCDEYIPGSNLTVTNEVEYDGFLSAMGVQVDLPDGWSYVSHSGDGEINVKELASGYLEIFWGAAPPPSPINYTYTVSVPDWASGTQEISARALYRRTGEEFENFIIPNPLRISQHSINGYIEGTVSPNVVAHVTTTGGGEAWTKTDGTFFMPHISGTFILTAKADGYETFTKSVSVINRQITTVNIPLVSDVDDTKPIADIVSPASDVTIHEGESVDFYSSVTDGNPPFTYLWDFYGGFPGFRYSNEEHPGSITFHKADTYNVTFRVIDNDGDMSTASVTVTVLEASVNTPSASITSPLSNVTIDRGGFVNFEGTITGGNVPFEYSWDFGGGAVDSYMEDPGNVTFQDAGTYIVIFKVTDEDGDTSSDSVTVTVKEPPSGTYPIASIQSPYLPVTIYEGESVYFQGSVTSGDAPFMYSWDFGGAAPNSNLEDPGYVTFQNLGVYTVSFTVTEANNIQDTSSDFVTITVIEPPIDTWPKASIVSPVSDTAINPGESLNFLGSVVEGDTPFMYSWDFDGAAPNSNLEDPGSITFQTARTYTVTFTVTEVNKPEDTSSASVIIRVKEPIEDTVPEPSIVSPLSDMTIYEGESLNFEGLVVDGDMPFTYLWDFAGVVPNSDLEDPGSVEFTTEGVYKITFTVIDADNDMGPSDSVTIEVIPVPPEPSPPKASIQSPPSDMTIKPGESLNFQGTVADGNPPFSYSWSFDGVVENSDAKNPGDVTFPAQGEYRVTFTVTDIDGKVDSDSVMITVKDPDPADLPPKAFIASPLVDVTILEGKSVDFQGTVADGNAPFTYSWNFRGGATNSNLEDPGDVTFSREGVYLVTFTVRDVDGDEDSDSLTVTVTSEELEGYSVMPEMWIGAVIHTEEKGPVEAVWRKGGEDSTAGGDSVIWGYFYASPTDVEWGHYQNPEVFVKIWFDRSGRVDVNYFHVSVPDIAVYSDYPYDDNWDKKGMTTLETRYIRQYYENGQSYMEDRTEDGYAAEGTAWGDPSGERIVNGLRIGSVIKTEEMGPIDAVWRKGGYSNTSRGDEVVWGLFHADPDQVNWGSRENPDLFVKIWFDASGRLDVNFFHVSVPDIEVFSDFPYDGRYDQEGVAIMDDRYIRHEYQRP
ncbi:PKD domain-containing protein [Desulfobacterales bacterium HSG2]|nr:PKD domain-containing protein [Desulfobacterales bacterium HSG2]